MLYVMGRMLPTRQCDIIISPINDAFVEWRC